MRLSAFLGRFTYPESIRGEKEPGTPPSLGALLTPTCLPTGRKHSGRKLSSFSAFMHELFRKRRSIRQFQAKPVEPEKIREILSAAMVAPSAMNQKKYEFVVVTDKKQLAQLGKGGIYQDFISRCAVAIVIVSEDVKYWIQDAALVAGYIYLEATNQGLGACWANVQKNPKLLGGDREEYVKKFLGVPSDMRVLCMMGIGYPAEKKEDHSENEYNSSKVHKEKW